MEKALVTLDQKTNRIVMRHGPIDMFVKIDADDPNVVGAALSFLSEPFGKVLPSLCEELPTLRTNVEHIPSPLNSTIGKKMYESAAAVSGYDAVTPMIAVAGSVADHICGLIDENFETKRVIVNNGGDISFKLDQDQSMTVGICDDVSAPEILTTVELGWLDPIGGMATSGWRGRSFSLGIADAVTVLAKTASQADAAATLIANAIDLPGSSKVFRQSASELSPDSDLGERKVTIDVGVLSESEKEQALSNGAETAEGLKNANLLHSAYLSLRGSRRVISSPVGVQIGSNSHQLNHIVI
jgi:uncharacterized protein